VRKLLYIFVALLMLPVLGIGALIAMGTVDTTSVRMMLNVMGGFGGPEASDDVVQQRYSLPDGFALELYANNIPKARFLRFTAGGDLLVSRPHAGDILLVRSDANGDGKADAVETLIGELKRPLGLDFAGDWLYIAENHQVGRVKFDAEKGQLAGEYEPVIQGLTSNGGHWSKTVRIGADQKLYLAQGSTCNICEEQDKRRATMMRFDLDGSNGEIIATGLRNSVGFDWAPWNGLMYATDNGRDLMGDDYPPCELNQISDGNFYGWPYFNGNNEPDPDMGPDPRAAERTPTAPVHGFRAHNAPLGVTFLNAEGWPSDYERSALVALHGSWNRSEPDGYKVVSLHWTDAGIEERDFLSGFEREGDISGRPVDIAQGPDGAIYISDDYAGAIYRVTYTGDDGVSINMDVAEKAVVATSNDDWLADADLEALLDEGQQVYTDNGCAECHGDGEGQVDLQDLHQRLNHAQVIDALQAPQAPMPIYPFTEQQYQALSVYLLHQEQ
jgi:glucose/arabinose dehydrogenase